MVKFWSIVVLIAGVSAVAWGAPQRAEVDARDADGGLVAKVVVCHDCKDPHRKSSDPCDAGASDGWRDGQPCGSCLLQANWGILIEYAYDLHVNGTLVDAAGEPVVGRFVKMSLPNGWSVRTRTADDGSFRLMLGATLERKSPKPIVVDMGKWVDSVHGEDPHFSLYLLPPDYKPCTSATPMPQSPSIDTLGP